MNGVERQKFPPSVAEKLEHYVYLLIDPRKEIGAPDRIFYVGEGMGNRVFAHARDALDSDESSLKLDRIREIHAESLQVRTELLRFKLDMKTAFEVEAAAIELLGLTELANKVAGHGNLDHGRMSTDDAIAELLAEPIDVSERAVLIRPARLWYRNMPDEELLEATAGWWRMGTRREGAKYAFAVVHGVVRGVWRIESWRQRAEGDQGWEDDVGKRPRWGFLGKPAPAELQRKYLGRSVAHYWKQGAQTGFTYVNC